MVEDIMNSMSAVLLACGFAVAGMMSIAPAAGEGSNANVSEKAWRPDEAEQALNEQLGLFDKTMEPGYLDKALEIVKGMPDHDAQGKLLPERRQNRLKAMFRLFRAATDSIDANYIPEMARLQWKKDVSTLPVPAPMPDKVASGYLYDYIQSGLRVFRFQIRVDILDYIRSTYQGIPSPEERRDLLAAAQGLDAEFVALLGDFMQMDVSWRLDKNQNMPCEETEKDVAVFLADMKNCLHHMKFLDRAMDPLYLPDDNACMNIPPPMPVAPDGMCIAGQSPDSIKNPESRRQYLIALHENGRKSKGVRINRKLEDQLSDMQRAFFGRFKNCELLDGAGMQTLWQTAEQANLGSRFMDNLREARAIREIDSDVKQFEKTKDRRFLDQAATMLESFQICKDRMRGREFLDTFQLERWLRLFHVVSSDPAFKDGDKVKADLEDKIMVHIDKSCGKSRFYLKEARWWLNAYGVRKPLIERINQTMQNTLQEEKQEIEKHLAAVEQNFTLEAFRQTDGLIYRLWDSHHNFKTMFDVLDFKIRCWFRLLVLLEGRLDPDYGVHPPEGISMSLPKEGLILKHRPAPPAGGYHAAMQLKLHELYSSFHDNLLYMLESCYERSRENQKRALLLVAEMKVKPDVVKRLQMKFDERNLRESLSDLGYEKKGDPEAIAAEIDRIYRSEDIDPENALKPLRDRFSNQFDLLQAMEKSGVRGPAPFERTFRDGMMTSINADIPDTWEGFCLLKEVLRMAEKSPLEEEIKDLWNNRRNANIARLNEKLTAFEADGNLKDLDASIMVLSYIHGGYGYEMDLVLKDRAARREEVEAYLRLIRAVTQAHPEKLVHRQGAGWNANQQTDPVKQMEQSLKNREAHFKSIFFSFVRELSGCDPKAGPEIREIMQRFGMDGSFQKQVEERLGGAK